LYFWGLVASPNPATRGMASGLDIRSRWPERFARFLARAEILIDDASEFHFAGLAIMLLSRTRLRTMYNLFVTADCDAWNGEPAVFDLSRCIREYTDEALKKYSAFAEADRKFLMSLPCLFAYESSCEKDARIGRLINIQQRGSKVRVSYQIYGETSPLSHATISQLAWDLGIGDWEMTRTHWALKNEDLHTALRQHSAEVPGQLLADITTQIFDVALSFPGEIRPYVESVAKELVSLLGFGRVFYDNFFKSQLAQPNLDILLQDIYRNRSKLIVAFLCKSYSEKEWCGLELRAVRDLIKAKKDKMVMYIRTDQGEVPGVFSTDGFIDANDHTPAEVAKFIVERLRVMLNR
jgi:hypothetical protein